jgi:predicted amidohydrolase
VDPEQFYAEVRKQRAEEDKKGIKVEHRQYFSGGKFDETDLLCRLDPTDTRLAEEQCLICQDGFVPEARDPRMMPCEHIFHWACISQWYYRTSRTCPYCRRGYQVMTLPRFLPPP